MRWAERYVGLPFVDHGRDFKGVDCWGLCKLVMWEEKGIELPSYGETSALDLAMVAKIVENQSAIDPWVPVFPTSVEPFDVAVMYRRKEPIHMGILVTKLMLLHIEEKTNACLVPLADPRIVFRYPRFYRHRELIKNAA